MVATDDGWERALELAWEAFCANTTPVGAVVVNALPTQFARAAAPRTLRLVTDLAAIRAPLTHLRSALRTTP